MPLSLMAEATQAEEPKTLAQFTDGAHQWILRKSEKQHRSGKRGASRSPSLSQCESEIPVPEDCPNGKNSSFPLNDSRKTKNLRDQCCQLCQPCSDNRHKVDTACP